MKINLVNESFDSLQSDLEVIFVLNKDLNHKSIKDKKLLESLNFKAEDEEVVLLPESKKIYVGCEDNSYDCIAVAISAAVKKLQSTKFKSAKVKLLDGEASTLKALVEGAALGAYSFTKYKSKKTKNKQELFIVTKNSSKELTKTFNDSLIIAESVNKTRDFVNTTPEDFYPKTMTKEAKKISKLDDITLKVHGEEYLEKNKMFSMLGVGRASRHESQLIHLTYKPKNAKTKVVLVGKGLTYDSGGLSLKPGDSMVTMKSDKAGACMVLGALNAIAQLKLPIEVHCILGAVENMIGGDAFKPDDVLTAKNGTTIEVRNTDAEGRLVLADCLCYAQDKIKDIDYIFDYATLTGACVVGVGEYTTAIMGNNTGLRCNAIKNASASGEFSTSLPFNRHLRKLVKSKIADTCNMATSRYGGAITAGLFLDNFIYKENKDKWLHFDIAGPAYVENAWGYNPYGASGAGVRMTVEFMNSLSLDIDKKCQAK